MQTLYQPRVVRPLILLLTLLVPLLVTGGSANAEEAAMDALAEQLGSAFTHQGQLKRDGGAFSGECAFRFGLWDAESDGTEKASQELPALSVTDGLFTAQLDFGNHFRGESRWLETQVQCEGDDGYTTLAPRVLLTSSPYAIGLMPGAEVDGAIASTFGVLRAVNRAEGAAIVGLAVPSTGVTYGILGNAFSPNGAAVAGYTENGGTAVRGLANDSGYGVHGSSNTGSGVIGTSLSWVGVYGQSDSAFGVEGKSKTGAGVVGTSTSWIGVYGESTEFQGVRGVAHNAGHGAVVGEHRGGGIAVFGDSQNGDGVWGQTNVGNKAGVVGLNNGNGSGVYGRSVNGGAGVFGTSQTGDGVWGETNTSNKAGVVGINHGNGSGVYGRSVGGGFAGYFEGKVGGRTVHVFGGADLAEWYNVTGVAEPGALMVIDPDNPGHLMPSRHAYDTRVAGVVSGAGGVNPGLTLQQTGVLEGDTQVAIAGRVFVQAEAFSAPIQPGDLLTTSELAGHAMKALDRERAYGAVIGKAMTGLDAGTGLVLVLVNLQ
jgi:hypothetical protein